MKTPDNPHFGRNGGMRRYRYISLVAPMGPHDTPGGRQHNMKLYYVLRWFLYTQTPGSAFFSIKAKSPVLPHGGQCLRAHCAISQSDFLNSAPFQALLSLLRADQLTPCLYMFDGYADGADKKMPTIDIIGHKRRNILHWPDITPGNSLSRSHIPYFARQILENGKNKPVQEIAVNENNYRTHFGLPA